MKKIVALFLIIVITVVYAVLINVFKAEIIMQTNVKVMKYLKFGGIGFGVGSAVGQGFLVFKDLLKRYKKKKKQTVKRKKENPENKESDSELNLIYDNLKEIDAVYSRLDYGNFSELTLKLKSVLGEIYDYVTENPGKLKSLREFTNYYLPTAVRFLKTYEELNAKSEKGKNILSTLAKIEDIITDITVVFKNVYDNLYSDEVMDINAEISVMRSVISEDDILSEHI